MFCVVLCCIVLYVSYLSLLNLYKLLTTCYEHSHSVSEANLAMQLKVLQLEVPQQRKNCQFVHKLAAHTYKQEGYC